MEPSLVNLATPIKCIVQKRGFLAVYLSLCSPFYALDFYYIVIGLIVNRVKYQRGDYKKIVQRETLPISYRKRRQSLNAHKSMFINRRCDHVTHQN